MDVPEGLLYSKEHEWVQTVGSRFRVGITDYAQDALGDVVFVELPSLGQQLDAGAPLGEIESTKSVSEIYAPLAGTVVAVNAELADSPERINEDPYGEGWICELDGASAGAADALLDADAYRRLLEG
jgi:glycine cleavage system H protein